MLGLLDGRVAIVTGADSVADWQSANVATDGPWDAAKLGEQLAVWA